MTDRPASAVIPPDSVEVRLRYHAATGPVVGADFVMPRSLLERERRPVDIAFYIASLALPFCRAVEEARRAPSDH